MVTYLIVTCVPICQNVFLASEVQNTSSANILSGTLLPREAVIPVLWSPAVFGSALLYHEEAVAPYHPPETPPSVPVPGFALSSAESKMLNTQILCLCTLLYKKYPQIKEHKASPWVTRVNINWDTKPKNSLLLNFSFSMWIETARLQPKSYNTKIFIQTLLLPINFEVKEWTQDPKDNLYWNYFI